MRHSRSKELTCAHEISLHEQVPYFLTRLLFPRSFLKCNFYLGDEIAERFLDNIASILFEEPSLMIP